MPCVSSFKCHTLGHYIQNLSYLLYHVKDEDSGRGCSALGNCVDITVTAWGVKGLGRPRSLVRPLQSLLDRPPEPEPSLFKLVLSWKIRPLLDVHLAHPYVFDLEGPHFTFRIRKYHLKHADDTADIKRLLATLLSNWRRDTSAYSIVK